MKRLLAVAPVWLALSLGIAHAVPARPLYEPPDAVRPPAPLNLRGTTWQGKDHVDNYRVTFEADGTLSYGHGGRTNRGGSWVLEGSSLYWEVNKKYREFRGTVAGDVLQGESWNKTGKRWQTYLKRVQ